MERIKLRRIDLFQFVVNHKTDCYRAFKLSVEHKGYKLPDGLRLIEMARKELRYSPRTYSGDIYMVLYRTYKGIVIDGANSPNEIKRR